MKKFTAILLTLIFILSLCSCDGTSPKPENTDNGKITVVTTVFPVYDWTRNVAGENCNVVYLDESGTDMHSFEPTANNIMTLAKADVFIHIGGLSDEWVEAALSSADNDDLLTLSLMEIENLTIHETAQAVQEVHNHDHEHTQYELSDCDEHIWLSLKMAQTCVTEIARVLSEADTENASLYSENAKSYNTKLSRLDSDFEECVKNADCNTLLFADRFPFLYFTLDYGLDYYAAFPGCSAETEASFETITFLIEKTKELSLGHILTVENSGSTIAETISSETGAGILSMDACQSVTKEDIGSGFTYISAMENNLAVLTEALD